MPDKRETHCSRNNNTLRPKARFHGHIPLCCIAFSLFRAILHQSSIREPSSNMIRPWDDGTSGCLRKGERAGVRACEYLSEAVHRNLC
jgi:hypothetical protein